MISGITGMISFTLGTLIVNLFLIKTPVNAPRWVFLLIILFIAWYGFFMGVAYAATEMRKRFSKYLEDLKEALHGKEKVAKKRTK